MTSATTNTTPASKAVRITYWVSTGIIGLMMLFSAYMYFTAKEALEGFRTMGFPDWFRIELAIAKILGAIVLLAPLHTSSLGRRAKEWAYAGFLINYLSAAIAHVSINDTPAGPLAFVALLLVSYFTYQRLHPIVSR